MANEPTALGAIHLEIRWCNSRTMGLQYLKVELQEGQHQDINPPLEAAQDLKGMRTPRHTCIKTLKLPMRVQQLREEDQ